MRKLIAMALLGASAAFFAVNAPAQAMTAGSAGVAKAAAPADASNVHVVKRRWKRHRHWHRHRWHRHRGHRHRHWRHRRWYRPYYYGGYYPYYYHRRPRVGIYFSF
jgi:Ni/Co efflux regulator RcnB